MYQSLEQIHRGLNLEIDEFQHINTQKVQGITENDELVRKSNSDIVFVSKVEKTQIQRDEKSFGSIVIYKHSTTVLFFKIRTAMITV